MTDHIKHHVIRESAINGAMNALFNGVIAWWLVKHREFLPVWGHQGLAVDFAATAFVLVLIVTLIVVPLQRRKRQSIGPADGGISYPGRGLMRIASRSLLLTGLWLGCLSILLFVPPVLLAFWFIQVSAISPLTFALIKAIWAGGMAALMVVPMIDIALFPQQLATNQQTT